MKLARLTMGIAVVLLMNCFVCQVNAWQDQDPTTQDSQKADEENSADHLSFWRTDYANAQADAKADGKYVLLDFTGSDWCRYCIFMEKTVFSTDAFRDYAKENLECVYVDFPNESKLDEATTKQNEELKEKYKVEGFPTYVLLDPNSEEVFRTSGSSPWTSLFIERLDEQIHPEKYANTPELEWLTNEQMSSDVSYLTEKSDHGYTLHFLDSSSYSSEARNLKSDVFNTHAFRRYVAENASLVHSPISAMFPPVEHMTDDQRQAFEKYLHGRQQRAKQEKSPDDDQEAEIKPLSEYDESEYARLCYSESEYQMRSGWDLDRDKLPGLVLHRKDGSVVKVLNGDEIRELTRNDGAHQLVENIKEWVAADSKVRR